MIGLVSITDRQISKMLQMSSYFIDKMGHWWFEPGNARLPVSDFLW
jgi:hypothetical protein